MSAETLATLLGFLSAALVATTGILAVRLRTEAEKRQDLAHQVYENKRSAYGTFHGVINEVLASATLKNVDLTDPEQLRRVAETLMEVKKEIWTYGSPAVVKAYTAFNQYSVGVDKGIVGKNGLLVLLADLILAMRDDMGLSNKGLTALHILRMFINDIDDKYQEAAEQAERFQRELDRRAAQ